MKKLILLLFVFVLFVMPARGVEEFSVYSSDGKFGLQNSSGEKITQAKYNKMIRLGNTSWIIQKRGNFGIMDSSGNYLVQPKYKIAERYLGRFVKFGKGGKFGVFDELGNVIVEPKYSSVDLLYGKMFLVGNDYKYGLVGFDGRVILEPLVDDIYMPKSNVMMISYKNSLYEIEQISSQTLELPEDIRSIKEDKSNFKITEIITNPVASTGYGVVSAGDYFIKIFSSISPAYENTIDELVLNHGADVATILMKFSWVPKFPFVYARNYFNLVKLTNNSPFENVKSNLKEKIVN